MVAVSAPAGMGGRLVGTGVAVGPMVAVGPKGVPRLPPPKPH